MTGWPGQPVIYEINTAVWLDELARASGRPVTLADVAAADWDADMAMLMINRIFGTTWGDLPGRSWQLTGILGPNVFKRDGGELASSGLFVDLGPRQSHLLARQ